MEKIGLYAYLFPQNNLQFGNDIDVTLHRIFVIVQLVLEIQCSFESSLQMKLPYT